MVKSFCRSFRAKMIYVICPDVSCETHFTTGYFLNTALPLRVEQILDAWIGQDLQIDEKEGLIF